MFVRKTTYALAIAERDEARADIETIINEKAALIVKLGNLRRGTIRYVLEIDRLKRENDQLRADLAKFNTRGPGGRFVKRAATDPVRAA